MNESFEGKNKDFEVSIHNIGNELINLYEQKINKKFEETTELERQVLATHLFGMCDGLRQESNIEITPADFAAVFTNMLITVFKYSKIQANDFFNTMVANLQSKNPNNTSYTIIHNGLNAYFTWQKEDKNTVIEYLYRIINNLNGEKYGDALLRFTSTGTVGVNILFPPKFEFVFYNDKLEVYKKEELVMTVNYDDIKEIMVVKNWQNNVIINCKPKSLNIYKVSDEICNKIKEITGK